jgi:hypothetical protein
VAIRVAETPAGIYFYRLSDPGFDASRKIVRQ